MSLSDRHYVEGPFKAAYGEVYPSRRRAKMCDASARGAKGLADDEAIKMERLSRYLQRDH